MAKGRAANEQAEQERRRKISEWRQRRKETLGFINSPETRQRIAQAQTGRALSSATRARLSAALKGRRPANFEAMLAKAHAMPKPTGEQHPHWKGEHVGYHALHSWLNRKFGRPQGCERCGTTTAKKFEWANKSRMYHRVRSDWERLCVSCHRKDGFAMGEYESWNKGKKTGLVPRSAFKRGHQSSPSTQFKKGQPAHNKWIPPLACKQCGTVFQPNNYKRVFCTPQCYWDSMRR